MALARRGATERLQPCTAEGRAGGMRSARYCLRRFCADLPMVPIQNPLCGSARRSFERVSLFSDSGGHSVMSAPLSRSNRNSRVSEAITSREASTRPMAAIISENCQSPAVECRRFSRMSHHRNWWRSGCQNAPSLRVQRCELMAVSKAVMMCPRRLGGGFAPARQYGAARPAGHAPVRTCLSRPASRSIAAKRIRLWAASTIRAANIRSVCPRPFAISIR